VNARGGPTSLFWLAPNLLLNSLAALPIKVPFHSIIGNRGIDEGADSSDGIVDYESSHLEGAESEKNHPGGPQPRIKSGDRRRNPTDPGAEHRGKG
jgi:hypothetical protein